MEAVLEEELYGLEQKALYRKMRILRNGDGVSAELDHQRVLLFCSNDYLGLTRHPRILRRVHDVLDQEGVGSGASRLISGTSEIHDRLEKRIAAFKGQEKALVYSSGYMANVGAITAFAGPDDLIVMDKLCHASIIDGARLSGAKIRVFPHQNYERCESILKNENEYARRFLISETLFSMDGDIANIKALVAIKKKYDCLLMVDDAHGTGVLGHEGSGALEEKNLSKDVDLLIGTLSKAVGCQGGFVASSEKKVDYLVNHSRPFIFATSLSPLLCHATDEAFRVIEEEPSLRVRLWENTHYIYQGLKALGFQLKKLESPIIPVVIGEEAKALKVAELLLEQGLFVPAIRTPTVPKGQARLRVTVSTLHSRENMDALINGFKYAKDQLGQENHAI